jgi:predicted DNA-binding transcriptional regulator AlpA
MLSAVEVACWLSINVRTVWRWTSRGILPRPHRLGRRSTRWRAGDIQKFLDDLQQRREEAS